VVHFAATRIGAVSNPLIPIYRDREVGFMVTLAESKLLVIPAEFRGYGYAAMVDRLRPEWPVLQQVLVLGGELMSTSGTTGEPKGVMHTHNTWGGPRT
jgi:acyl-coenzyme A synthetase/AMP-(fatty) acid ligase